MRHHARNTNAPTRKAPTEAPCYVELIRVSSKAQADKMTPANQAEALEKMRVTFPGTLVARIDDGAKGLSGARAIEERADIQKLFALLASGQVTEVRVVALDRLSRSDDMTERTAILHAVKEAGAVIRLPDGSVTDPATQTGELMGSLSLMFAAWERQKIKDRTLAGRLRKVAAGRPGAGNQPYALRFDKTTETWSIVLHEAEVVRRMFQLARDGVGIEGIVQRLGDDGARTRRNLPWNRAGIRDVLHSTAYVGDWVQKYRGTSYTAKVPAIIDRALFEEVQAAMQRRRLHSGRPYSREVLCRALAYCGVCGRTMHISSKRGEPIYQCSSIREGTPCGNARMQADSVDDAVWEALAERLRDPSLLDAAAAPKAAEESAAPWQAQVASAERRLERADKLAAAIVEARAVGDVSQETAANRLDDIRRQRQAAQQELDAAQAALARLEQRQFDRAGLADRVAALKDRLDAADFSVRRALFEAIVPQVEGYGVALGPSTRIFIKGALGPPTPRSPEGCQPRGTSCTSCHCRTGRDRSAPRGAPRGWRAAAARAPRAGALAAHPEPAAVRDSPAQGSPRPRGPAARVAAALRAGAPGAWPPPPRPWAAGASPGTRTAP